MVLDRLTDWIGRVERRIALRLRIQAGSFEVACRLVETGVGVGVMPESTAHRLRRTTAIAIVPLRDAWALRQLQVCARSLGRCHRSRRTW